ncbi:MAG: hypothetical protein P4L57_06305 [Rhizomicrobium sp.]|nr:hypothetical protein [Rhizomicrobium sp.]
MNALQKHDPATGDLTVYEHTMVQPSAIPVGNLPNMAMDDLRGHAPPPETDSEADNTKMIIGAAVIAVVIGSFGVFSYTSGMWDSKPAVPLVLAINSAPPAVPAVATQPAVVAPALPAATPQQAIVPPVAPTQAAPAIRTPKQQAKSAVKVLPTPAAVPAMSPVEPAPLSPTAVTPVEPIQSAPQPVPPTQALPDQAPPAQTPPATEPPQ